MLNKRIYKAVSLHYRTNYLLPKNVCIDSEIKRYYGNSCQISYYGNLFFQLFPFHIEIGSHTGAAADILRFSFNFIRYYSRKCTLALFKKKSVDIFNSQAFFEFLGKQKNALFKGPTSTSSFWHKICETFVNKTSTHYSRAWWISSVAGWKQQNIKFAFDWKNMAYETPTDNAYQFHTKIINNNIGIGQSNETSWSISLKSADITEHALA